MSFKSVLIVEDSDEDQFLNSMIIDEFDAGIEVHQAYNGQEALDLLEQGIRPDLILLDINMPLMDGFGFLDGFTEKYGDRVSSQVVIMLSSSGQTGDIRKAKSYACVKDYLLKPLTSEMLKKIRSSFF